ncbi:MAG: hypothetical protein KA270_17340 [Saprospiraceae bacterium]|nr:hypothetical protein [Saprospiraceae bacterium]
MNTKAENQKKSLIRSIDQMTEEQINLLYNVSCGDITKSTMIDLIFSAEDARKVDTAYPQEYQNEVIKVIGGHNCPNFVHSYIKSPVYGELVNIDRLFISKIYQIFR